MTHTEEAPMGAEHKKYELALILQPELLSSVVEKKLKEFEAFLAENEATVDLRDIWEKRELAYRIGKHDQGIYVMYNLTMPGTFNQELDEHLRIDKDVIRFLLLSTGSDYEYQKYDEEKLPVMKTASVAKNTNSNHKADDGGKKAEVKDKGKKADAESLDQKLDSILEGNDLEV